MSDLDQIESVELNALDDPMAFTVPEYTPDEIDSAGELLTKEAEYSYDELVAAYSVVNNWRSSHSFPLRTIRYGIYHKAKRVAAHSITVQRLKRIYSITLKLRRFKNLRLSAMQDLGGCRCVVTSVSDVIRLVKAYKGSDIRHVLDDEDDYISAPKKSGYRSHHLIYRYQSDRNTTYNNLKIEIQIRSRLQHAWATAVETVGTFIGQALKSSQGKDEGKDWLRFFTLMGTAIAIREGSPHCPGTPATEIELKSELRDCSKRLDVENRLNAYGVTITAAKTAQSKDAKFFLLQLDANTKTVSIKGYRQDQLKLANDEYTKIETAHPQRSGKDAVLVSGESLLAIQQAYPNYYLDTSLFVEALKKATL